MKPFTGPFDNNRKIFTTERLEFMLDILLCDFTCEEEIELQELSNSALLSKSFLQVMPFKQ